MSRRNAAADYKIYVGDLGSSASKQDLEDAFGYYGPLRNVWVARNPPGFAFIEFEDARDADDAVRGLDGRTVCGRRVRVEHSAGHVGRRRGGDRGPPRRGGGGGRAFNPDDRCYECGERGHYARDCKRYKPRSRRSRSGSRSRSRSRGAHSRSRSRSRDRKSLSPVKGRSRSKDRSPSPRRNMRKSSSRSRSRDSDRRNGN